jgi:hypothetical protein
MRLEKEDATQPRQATDLRRMEPGRLAKFHSPSQKEWQIAEIARVLSAL